MPLQAASAPLRSAFCSSATLNLSLWARVTCDRMPGKKFQDWDSRAEKYGSGDDVKLPLLARAHKRGRKNNVTGYILADLEGRDRPTWN